jgi:prolyl-tRNA synthetase
MVHRRDSTNSLLQAGNSIADTCKVLLKGQMLDYYDISGCYILRPWSYTIWQTIQSQ